MADTNSEDNSRARGWLVLKHHMLTHKVGPAPIKGPPDVMTSLQIDVLLWLTRVATIIFSVGYILPVFGNPYNSYYKALMASASTSALRLHQRLPQVQFNRQFLGERERERERGERRSCGVLQVCSCQRTRPTI